MAVVARPRVRRRRVGAVVAGTAAAVLVTVVAATAVSPSADRLDAVPAAPPAHAVPPERTFLLPPDADERIYYSEVRSDPLTQPPPHVLVSSASAVSKARGGPPGAPTSTLRMVSAPPHLSGIPSTPRPFWVLTWSNTSPGAVSGPAMPNRRAQAAAYRRRREQLARAVCADVTFVNADTGRQADGIWQICVPR